MIHDVGTPSGRLSRNEVSLRELLGGGGRRSLTKHQHRTNAVLYKANLDN